MRIRIAFSLRIFFGDFGGKTGHSSDDEHQFAERRWESHIEKDGRERTIDIDRQRTNLLAYGGFERRHELDPFGGDTGFARHIEKDVGARIMCVDPVSEARQTALLHLGLGSNPPGRFFERDRLAQAALHPFSDQFHARGARSAMFIPNCKNPRRDSG